jgi:CBS domain containing-hemolysin-like protein
MDLLAVILTIALLAGNAFFVGAEFALITARRDQLEPLAARPGRQGRRATAALYGIEHLSLMLAGAQLGVTLCSLGLGSVGEPAIAHLIATPLDAVGAPEGVVHPVAFAVALLLVVALHMVLGEMVPKNVSLAGPVRAALLLGPPMVRWTRITKPVLLILNGSANGILRLLRIEPKDELEVSYTAEEIASLVVESRAEGFLDDEAQDRLTRAISTEQRTAGDVALGWHALVTIPADAPIADAERAVAGSGYSRFPLCDADGHLIGYLHAKDLLDLQPDEIDGPLPARLVRSMTTLDATTPLAEAVRRMRHDGAHLGLVMGQDPDGPSTIGVVALEDLLEELVGQVNETAPLTDRDVAASHAS